MFKQTVFKQITSQKLVSGCKHILKIGLFGLYATLSLSTGISLAEPITKLENWRFYPEAQQLEVMLSGSSQPRYFYLSQPPRIVVDLPDTKLGYVPTQQNFYGTIQSIRVSQFDENVTRIVMDLAPGVFFDASRMRLQPISRRNSVGWLFRPLLAGNSNSIRPNSIRRSNYRRAPLQNNYSRPYSPLPRDVQLQRRDLPRDSPNGLPQLSPGLPLPGLGSSLPQSDSQFYNNRNYNNRNYNQQQQQLPLDLPRNLPGESLPGENLPGESLSNESFPRTLPQQQFTPSIPQPSLGDLPPVNGQFYNNGDFNQQRQPLSVPPIPPTNSSFKEFPIDSVLPPARFSNQSGRGDFNNRPNNRLKNRPKITVPNFPVPNIPKNINNSNNSNNSNNPKVIEFGQPFPSDLP